MRLANLSWFKIARRQPILGESSSSNNSSILAPLYPKALLINIGLGIGIVGLLASQTAFAWFSSFGLDLTDESSYINSLVWYAHYPYSWGGSEAARLYGWIYELTGENLATLRAISNVTSWLIACFFCSLVYQRLVKPEDEKQITKLTKYFWILSGASVSGLSQGAWLPTPSYNTLAWQSVVIFAIGLLIPTHAKVGRSSILGFSLALAFLAKPPVGLGLIVVLFIANFPLRRTQRTEVLGSLGITSIFLLLWGFLVHGSVTSYLSRLQTSYYQITILDAGQLLDEQDPLRRVLNRLAPFSFSALDSLIPFVVGMVALAWLMMLISGNFRSACRRLTIVSLLAVLALSVTLSFGLFRDSYLGQLTLMGIGSVILLSVLRSFKSALKTQDNRAPNLERRADLQLAAVLFTLPFAFAAGTSNHYVQHAAALGILFLATALLMVKAMPNQSRPDFASLGRMYSLQISSAVLVMTVTLLSAAGNPYRQMDPVYLMKPSSSIHGIHVDSEVFEYMAELERLKVTLSLPSGVPIIDNTGVSPGAVLALGGLPLGSPWLIGGYPGSKSLANLQLSRYSPACLSAAMVIDEPAGSQRIYSVEDEELPIPKKLKLVAVAKLTNPNTGNEQILYRSLSPEMTSPLECTKVSGPTMR